MMRKKTLNSLHRPTWYVPAVGISNSRPIILTRPLPPSSRRGSNSHPRTPQVSHTSYASDTVNFAL
ncbi:hypothetical protein DL93DRAFT_2092044, partial [Clavulina sp. PMI_390]